MDKTVTVERCIGYRPDRIDEALEPFDPLFAENIRPGDTVALKPNWIAPWSRSNKHEWESVITHPRFITGVLKKVIRHLRKGGSIVIADGPQTDSSFRDITERMPVREWEELGRSAGVRITILDLRDHEWVSQGEVTVSRKELPGDPLGSVEFNLAGFSEFEGHRPSARGYHGADYDVEETNRAHSNGNHLYRVSRSIIAADVVINLPKWKTHKKAGITCSLKNLVGINTYKNYLPHHTTGTPSTGGDQFPDDTLKHKLEVRLLEKFKRFLQDHPNQARYLIPVRALGERFFGSTKDHIRNGNWYGNNTLWRTILDLNKILFYGRSNGSLVDGEQFGKRYISLVDGIVAGQGNGPESPDPLPAGLIIGGTSPVSVDCAAARLMGFDYRKIPALDRGFKIQHLPLSDFRHEDIQISSRTVPKYCRPIEEIPKENSFAFEPHFGWKGHIEIES